MNLNKYYVGELAKYFGVSNDTLRLYDKKGILSPNKDDENNYRVYSREDFICLDYIMRLKKIGMPLSDINMMINDCTLEKAEAMMEIQEKILNEKIEEMLNMKSVVTDYIRDFRNAIQEKGKITVEQSPAFVCKKINKENSTVDAMGAFSKMTSSHVPKFTFSCSKKNFMSSDTYKEITNSEKRQEIFDYLLTLRDTEDFQKKEEYRKGDFYVFKSCRCLHSVVTTSLNTDYSEIEKCKEYIEKEGYVLKGDVILRILMSMRNLGKRSMDIYEIWAPIE